MSALAQEAISFEIEKATGLYPVTNQETRPPKLTQHEAAFLLDRGPYIARLAAQEKLLAYAEAISTIEGEYGPNLPAYVAQELAKAVETARAELEEYDAVNQAAPAIELKTEIPPVAQPDLQRSLGERTVRVVTRDLSLLETKTDGDWRERALCAQTDPEEFYPEKGGSTREAKKVCLTCEVRDECLAWALENDERHGIWGGLSERERRKLKKRAV